MKQETTTFEQPVIFRMATPGDAEEILELYQSATAAGMKNGTTDWDLEYPNRQTVEYDLSQDGLFLLCQGKQICGAVSMIPHDDVDELPLNWSTNNACVLARMCIRPDAQGRGLAKRLLGEIRKEAKRRGYTATRHMSAQSVDVTTHLYRTLGFRQLGEAHLYDTDFFCFEKEL